MAERDFFNRLKQIDALHKLTLAVPPLTAPVRFSSYAAYRGLEVILGERHPHERVITQAKALQREFVLPAQHGPKVLFFTVRGWFAHVGIEAVLAKALQLRHAGVSFFLCGGVVPQCDFKPASDPYVTRPLCWRCFGFARRLLDAFELPFTDLHQLLGSGFEVHARETIARLSRADLEDFQYRDLPLFELALPSIQRSLLRGDPGEGVQAERVAAGMVEAGMVFADACEALIARERPDRIVATNGLFVAERVMWELAKRHGIPMITYERGMLPNSLIFDREWPVPLFHMDEIWSHWRTIPLTSHEEQTLDDYLASRSRGNVGQPLWPKMDSDRDALFKRFQVRPDRPLVVMFTNIMWDSAVFRCDVGFHGMMDWIVTTIAWFAQRTGYQLLIRHPSEVRLPMAESRDRVIDRVNSAFPKLPANIGIVDAEDAADSYVLLRRADAVMVYASTTGVEAAVAGKPVIVGGQVHYRNRGFTFDLEDSTHLDTLVLESITRGHISPEMQSLARRYAYAFFFRFQHRFPWVNDDSRKSRRLDLHSLAELQPGRSEVLDQICDGITHLTPFVSEAPIENLEP